MSDELTASLHCLTCSPAAPPLEDDNLLAEILLRLPPLPSSLPRASAVSRRWRSIASDTRFCSRFRAHHRRNPPLLGYFVENKGNIHFQPAMEAPNRVPLGRRFSFPIHVGIHFAPVGCRHGLVLSLHYPRVLLVWDPVTGENHCQDYPLGFESNVPIGWEVLRTAGDGRYFQVVLVGTTSMQQSLGVVASVYSSKTNTWSNITPLPVPPMYVYPNMPAVMIGDSLYWLLGGDSFGILKFNLGSQTLVVIPMPGKEIIPDDMHRCHFSLSTDEHRGEISLIMTEAGDLGFLLLSGFDAQLWKRTTNSDGVDSWALQRTIALDKLLSINPEEDTEYPYIIGFAENNNVVVLCTSIGVFTVQLESLQFKKLLESPDLQNTDVTRFRQNESYFPFEAVYTADMGIYGGHDGTELLQNK